MCQPLITSHEGPMDLEFHQIDFRYEGLRKRHPRKERQLLASLADHGQLLPVVVVAADAPFVLVDGYKRVRALKRLAHDTVRATLWAIEEADAVVLEHVMRAGDPAGPLEQGWMLDELRARFGFSLEDLGRRFDKTPSWVSRRLALVRELPDPIQTQVRAGRIAPHAAMKYLVPLARANREACLTLADAIARAQLSTRQVGDLYAIWQEGPDVTRTLLMTDPLLLLRARAEATGPTAEGVRAPAQLFLDDLGALAGVARRAHRRLRDGLTPRLDAPARHEASLALRQARADCDALFHRWDQETIDARSEPA
jgi:ParB family transcriptional regulator, chromosome partitioning protein